LTTSNSDYSEQDFNEIIANALQRIHGEKLYVHSIPDKDRHSILSQYISYRQIAKDINNAISIISYTIIELNEVKRKEHL